MENSNFPFSGAFYSGTVSGTEMAAHTITETGLVRNSKAAP